ncbi:MAG: hypothetical protein WA740_05270 [Candidatus Binataceae bacterium]
MSAIRTELRGDQLRSLREPAARILAKAAILLFSIVVLTLAYRTVARTITYNSDNACILLQGQDVAAGNLTLRGWTLSNCSFYPEIAFYAVAMLVNHSSSTLARIGGPLIYALVVMIALWLTGRGASDPNLYASYAITFILIALPSTLQHLYIPPGTHMSTMLLIFAALVALSFTEETVSRAPAAYVGYTLLLAFAVFGDLFALYFAAIPIAIVTAYRWGHSLCSQTRELFALLATLAATIIGTAALRFVSAIGGFRLIAIAPHFIALRSLQRNVSATIAGIAGLYGIDAAHTNTPLGAILLFSRSVGLILILGCCVLSAYRTLRGTENRTNTIVMAAVILDALEYVLNDKVIGVDAARYLIPFVLFGAILAGRVGGSLIRQTRVYYAAIGLVFVAYLFGFVRLMLQPTLLPQREDVLAQWLYQHGLVSGYGDYWHSSIVTLESDGKVKIRAVVFAGRLVPYAWESKAQWYSADSGEPAPNFVVIENPKRFMAAFETVSATRTLGLPSQTYQFQGYTIMVWDRGKWLLNGNPSHG